MMLASLDRRLAGLPAAWLATLATAGVGAVGLLDYFTGYEIALSILYLGPIGLAAWYGGRRTWIWIALLSCIVWFLADVGLGHAYSNAAIPVWNAFVRLGFFLIVAMLLEALRARLSGAQWLATNDPLTGLLNSRGFAERLEYTLALARRNRAALTVAYVDLDDFKRINDLHGHDAGDRLLRVVATTLKSSVRHSDAVARLGGDEFALLLPETDQDGAQLLLSKLREGLDEASASAGSPVCCSVGAVTFAQAPVNAVRRPLAARAACGSPGRPC